MVYWQWSPSTGSLIFHLFLCCFFRQETQTRNYISYTRLVEYDLKVQTTSLRYNIGNISTNMLLPNVQRASAAPLPPKKRNAFSPRKRLICHSGPRCWLLSRNRMRMNLIRVYRFHFRHGPKLRMKPIMQFVIMNFIYYKTHSIILSQGKKRVNSSSH